MHTYATPANRQFNHTVFYNYMKQTKAINAHSIGAGTREHLAVLFCKLLKDEVIIKKFGISLKI